jgi:hypothetical protein
MTAAAGGAQRAGAAEGDGSIAARLQWLNEMVPAQGHEQRQLGAAIPLSRLPSPQQAGADILSRLEP